MSITTPCLSLYDLCLGNVISNVSILSNIELPSKIMEDIQLRKEDEFFRVSPALSGPYRKEVISKCQEYVDLVNNTNEKENQILIVNVVYSYLCDNMNFLLYHPDFKSTIINKLIELHRG